MSYSNELESLIDRVLTDQNELEKKKMFGGIGYLLHGNMCFGIYKDELVLRTTAELADGHLEKEGFKPFDITGRAMKGWVMVEPSVCQNTELLQQLLSEGIRFASALPKKEK